MIAFGPIPSRRLGRSLGINNIPPKYCTYSCVYCQVGRTTNMGIERRCFYEPEVILTDVREHLERIHEPVDYLTFVPDGEPALDLHLGRAIQLLRTLDLPVAVITNSSLLWRPDVRDDLAQANWISLKVDAVREASWSHLNRPSRKLHLSTILAGMLEFAGSFRGELVTETMLVEGVNDDEEQLSELARFLGKLKPAKAYLSIPTRPPAENSVRAPDEETVTRGFHLLHERIPHVEYLTAYEGNAFACSGNLDEDLLSITAVHPLREEAVRALCERDHAGWERVEGLLREQQLAKVEYAGVTFYTRKWRIREIVLVPIAGTGEPMKFQQKGVTRNEDVH